MSAAESTAKSAAAPLAIICGGGSLPIVVAEAAQRRGRPVLLFALQETSVDPAISKFPHRRLSIAQYGRFVRSARAAGCRDVVAIGSLIRPSLWRLRFDLGGLRILPRVVRAYRHGDDGLLSGMGAILEADGFRLLGAHEVAPQILMPKGTLGRAKPSNTDWADIRRGLALLRTMGPFDVGQAVVISDNRALAIEAAEGTDEMLKRLAALREADRIRARQGGGVLVKAPKPDQDRRLDLPSIGPRTVEEVKRAGLAGIAVVAGSVIVAEIDRIAAVADTAGIFVVGVTEDGTAP